MTSIEEKLILQATVKPHWQPGDAIFWYLRHGESNKLEFTFVDVEKGMRKPAFNHKSLASELERQTGFTVKPDQLPFTWIEIQDDASYVQFAFHGKNWQYGPDEILQETEVKVHQPLQAEKASSHSSKPVSVKFANRSSSPVLLYWIDWEKTPVFYATLIVGAPTKQQTYEGHVWMLVDESSGETKQIYTVPNRANDVVTIKNTHFTGPNIKADLAIAGEENADEGNSGTSKVGAKSRHNRTTHAEGLEAGDSTQTDSKTYQESKRDVYVSNDNLWVKERDGSAHQLTWDGSDENKYDDVYVSPDELFAVAWQYTPEQEHIVNRVESSPEDRLEPKLRSRQYLKPGDRKRQDRAHLFDLESRRALHVDHSLFFNHYAIKRIGWNRNGEEYRFLFNERGHQHLRVLSIHRDGRVRVVVEESSDTFIDYSSKMYWRVIEETDEMLWASERDGYNHLYLVDLAKGTIKTQLTRGQWNVRSVDHVDDSRRRVWFKALGVVRDKDPYFAYPAFVDFDGSGLTAFTEGSGTHSWRWSTGMRYFVDTCSGVDMPPRTSIRDGETGKEIMLLEDSKIDELGKVSWNSPEIFISPGRDGKTPIYGVIIRPDAFDQGKPYPIIEDIYAGPQDFFTPKAFSPLTRQRELANEGYVVVKIDGMGTNWRCKSFHDVCYKNLKDGGFPDRIAWIKAAASSRPWMDLSRVGIFGGSAGGQNAAAAVLHHGDFYIAAAADCGCHDNRMDKLWWNEQWMGYPVDESYADSSNIVHANKLKGALMLSVGELDTNVDPSSTMQLVHALNEAGKDYEFLFIPGGEHGCGELEYAQRRRKAFFRRHLSS